MVADACSVVELRQYTLRGGQRDTLIDLFEREFVKPQNALGAHVLGTFRDLDDLDRFVWLRGFASMAAREAALSAFYGGPVWRAHRDAANATMVDSDNVLLLRPTPTSMPAPTFAPARRALVTADIHYLGDVDPQFFATFYEAVVRPRLHALGADPFATLATETSANTFPQLPVREHESVFVTLTGWSSVDQHDIVIRRLASLGGLRDDAPAAILRVLMRKPERLRLAPTRSIAVAS